MHRPFKVTVVTTTEHSFVVEANSPEEAESIAEEYAIDGEVGDVDFANHVVEEVTPVEVGDMGDVQRVEDD